MEKECDQFLLSDIGMACQAPEAYDRRYISVRLTRAFEAGWAGRFWPLVRALSGWRSF